MAFNQETLQRAVSDVSYELRSITKATPDQVEDAKCECCGMSEECTREYVSQVRETFYGKMVCGLCGEAIKEETVKNGGRRDKALEDHVVDCERFNGIGRAYPLLLLAEDVKKILKKKRSIYPNSNGFGRSMDIMKPSENRGSIARSSSC